MNTADIERESNRILDTMAVRLADSRKARRLGQAQAGEYVGTKQAYISNLENGHNRPGVVPLIVLLARTYRTSVDYLLGLTNDPTPASRRELSPSLRELRDMFEDLTPARQDEAMALLRAMRENQNRIYEEENQRMRTLIDIQTGSDNRSRTSEDVAQSALFATMPK